MAADDAKNVMAAAEFAAANKDKVGKVRELRGPMEGVTMCYQKYNAWLNGPHGPILESAFTTVEKQMLMKREQVTSAFTMLLAVYLIIGSGAQLVCNIIGFAYPAYISVKAVRTEGTDDDTEWLIYWTTFATFSVIDFFGASIMAIFPLYWLAKALFLVYLYAPETRGAQYLFWAYVNPLCTMIDNYLARNGYNAPTPSDPAPPAAPAAPAPDAPAA